MLEHFPTDGVVGWRKNKVCLLEPKYVGWNAYRYIWVSLHHINEKIILSRCDMEGGHLILFEMAVTWKPLVRFWLFQGQKCLKLDFWLKFWQIDHETTKTTWWFWWNWCVLELCLLRWVNKSNILENIGVSKVEIGTFFVYFFQPSPDQLVVGQILWVLSLISCILHKYLLSKSINSLLKYLLQKRLSTCQTVITWGLNMSSRTIINFNLTFWLAKDHLGKKFHVITYRGELWGWRLENFINFEFTFTDYAD